jgi:hypothetical protein
MTESEWLTSTDPEAMLAFLYDGGKASDRKLRLFFCACCRGDRYAVCPQGRAAVATAEALADGQANETVRGDTHRLIQSFLPDDGVWSAYSLIARSLHVEKGGSYPLDYVMTWAIPSVIEAGLASGEEVIAALHDLFGPLPFRPLPPVAPFVLWWDGGTVKRLAEDAYEQRAVPSGMLDTQRLAVLVDALEDAGCADADLLEHLRSPGPHVRGAGPLTS